MDKNEIVNMAKKIKFEFGDDPLIICEELGIDINYIKLNPKFYKAYTICVNDNPVININEVFTGLSTKILCAHELGHALMHAKQNTINQFEDDHNGICEYEANLFAVSLLFDDSMFDVDIIKMDNYLLKGILDFNLKLDK